MTITCPQCDGEIDTNVTTKCNQCGLDVDDLLRHLENSNGPLSSIAKQLRGVI